MLYRCSHIGILFYRYAYQAIASPICSGISISNSISSIIYHPSYRLIHTYINILSHPFSSSRRTPIRKPRVQRTFAHRIPPAKPCYEAFKPEPVAAVGGGAVSTPPASAKKRGTGKVKGEGGNNTSSDPYTNNTASDLCPRAHTPRVTPHNHSSSCSRPRSHPRLA